MTEPIKIPLLNVKEDGTPITHADLPPAEGIANKITVHEHHTVLQSLQAKFDELLNQYKELTDAHEELKTERSDPSNTKEEKEITTETTAEPPKSVATSSKEESMPASKPVLFTPKVTVSAPVTEVKNE